MTPDSAQEKQLISAAAMAAAVARDPNLQLPKHPRFADGLVVVPMPDGLLVEGTAERQVFRGRAATTLLPRLLPLMDGTRTTEDLAAALPDVVSEAVVNAVALLYMRGVLIDGAERATLLQPPLAGFLERHIDTTRVNRNVAEAAGRLTSYRVGVAGSADSGGRLVAHLKASGVHAEMLDPSSPALGGLDLLVAVAHEEDRSAWGKLDEDCANQGIPWLRSVFDGRGAELGPRFARPETCCYGCFSATHDRTTDVSQSPLLEEAWLTLLATEVIFHASRICAPLTTRDVVRFDFRDWTQVRGRAVRRPGCPVCCPLGGEAPRPPELAFHYEQLIEFPPKHLLNPKDHQVHYRVANLALQYEQKRYSTAEMISLPSERAPSIGPLDIVRLGVLLERTAGLRTKRTSSQKVQRWAPTGGNLGSVQVYVLARQVQQLDSGCYFYDADEHAFARLAPRRTEGQVAALMREALDGASHAAALVFTAALSRVAYKYGAFAYRIIHLDAGVAITQMGFVAASYGVSCRAAMHWDSQCLARELALGEGEPITVVVGLNARAEV